MKLIITQESADDVQRKPTPAEEKAILLLTLVQNGLIEIGT